MQRSLRRSAGPLLLLAAFVGGCSSAASPAPSVSAESVPPSAISVPSPGDSVTRPSFAPLSPGVDPTGKPVVLPKSVLDPILADAAQRSGVAVGQLVVVTSLSITWNDSSLGCAEPGQAYTQVILEGYRVSIKAGTTTYDYRGAGMSGFKLCKSLPG